MATPCGCWPVEGLNPVGDGDCPKSESTERGGGTADEVHGGAIAAGQGGGHQGHQLIVRIGSARRVAQVQVPVNQLGQAMVAGRIYPALATRRWSSKVILIRSGWLRGSIYWVLLLWRRFAVTKPLSQKHGNTFLPLQNTDPTPSFGGFGLK